jgi:hypothetical protein
MRTFGWDLDKLKEGGWYALWAGLPFGSKPGTFYSIFAVGVFGIGALEYRHGSRLAVLSFLVLGPLSSLITTLIIWPFDNYGNAIITSYLHTPDMGSSSSSLLCWGMFAGGLKKSWRWLVFTVTIIILAWFLIFYKADWGLDHLMSFLIGFGCSFVIIPRHLKSEQNKLKNV